MPHFPQVPDADGNWVGSSRPSLTCLLNSGTSVISTHISSYTKHKSRVNDPRPYESSYAGAKVHHIGKNHEYLLAAILQMDRDQSSISSKASMKESIEEINGK